MVGKRVEDVLCLLGKVRVMRFAKENIWSGLLEEGYSRVSLNLKNVFLRPGDLTPTVSVQ